MCSPRYTSQTSLMKSKVQAFTGGTASTIAQEYMTARRLADKIPMWRDACQSSASA